MHGGDLSAVQFNISIHAPVKGATYKLDYNIAPVRNFNPRTREGCDLQVVSSFI